MTSNGDEKLDELYVDRNEVNKELLVEALSGIVGIDSETGEMVPLQGFRHLSPSKRVIVYLLYRKAAHVLGEIEKDEMGATTQEISEKTNVKRTSFKKNISNMDIIEKDTKNGGYFIPDYSIGEATDRLPNKL